MAVTDEDEDVVEVTGPIFDGADLEAAKAFVQQHLRDGVRCPCCGQWAKIYRRRLNATMTYALCLVYLYFQKNPTHEWLHLPAFLVQAKHDSSIAGGDAAKLRFWGLIERAVGERDDGSDRVGRYRITAIGNQFVEGKIAVPAYIYLYNQALLRVSEEMTTVQQALGAKFNYAELLGIA